MAGTTNNLIEYSRGYQKNLTKGARCPINPSGEQVTSALIAGALNDWSQIKILVELANPNYY